MVARWNNGWNPLPFPPGITSGSSVANDISEDGLTVVGSTTGSSGTEACYWTPGANPVLLGPHEEANGVSGDGSVIVGGGAVSTGGTAVGGWWRTAAAGVTIFDIHGSARDISADGSRIVGSYFDETVSPTVTPAFWDRATGIRTLLPLPAGYVGGEAQAVSSDGSVIVGYMGSSTGAPGFTNRAFYWTAAGGVVDMGRPGSPPDSAEIDAQGVGVSDTGVAVGYCRSGDSSVENARSFTWTPSGGMVLAPDTTFFYGAVDISGDGSTLYGAGWYPDFAGGSANDNMAYVKNGVVVTPVPAPLGNSVDQGRINHGGNVMCGYSLGVTGFPDMSFAWVYVAPQLAMDNVIIGSPGCVLCLDWSDDRGHTFGVPVCQPLSSWGYLTSLQWQRLGYARDRIFRLTWSCDLHTALQGAWTRQIAEKRRGK